ncbi:MAG: protein kinase [Pirellulaceae bacterium]
MRQVEGQLQLRQEAACTKAVRHPNLIALLDARLSAPRPYVVFPRLEGQTLAAWLTQKYSQPVPVCLWWIRQAAQALQALHDAGWIHSDIKPENMLINLRGHLTLIDLGSARRSGETTSEDRYQGTPIYSAPEMFQSGGAAMPSGDVYSLGMVFYQTLAKTLPQETLRPLDFSILTKQALRIRWSL